ncbi:hypothetical protein BS47DRAFT_50979 [Hydnum rufescens UP504]|uniref:Uncharacterized protein n=1 Tax=Hydnum rufescens UP504 TaxID=1448309 RepID=A0A9P6ASM4_9AGAM|nr:hypothetical protein BS47DRAFT_50979 [Hydnum rufescens UP504]
MILAMRGRPLVTIEFLKHLQDGRHLPPLAAGWAMYSPPGQRTLDTSHGIQVLRPWCTWWRCYDASTLASGLQRPSKQSCNPTVGSRKLECEIRKTDSKPEMAIIWHLSCATVEWALHVKFKHSLEATASSDVVSLPKLSSPAHPFYHHIGLLQSICAQKFPQLAPNGATRSLRASSAAPETFLVQPKWP